MARRLAVLVCLTLTSSVLSGAPLSAQEPPACFGGLAHNGIQGTDGDDHIVGTEAADAIDAGRGNDVIEGLGGNDFICGDEGRHLIDGGEGDDTIRPGPGDDNIEGNVGTDRVMFEGQDPWNPPYFSSVTANLSRGFARGQGVDVLSGIEDLHGTVNADRLVGDDGPNLLIGGDHADFIDGKLGDDVIRAGFGSDKVYAGGGNDHVTAGPTRRRDGSIKYVFLGEGDDTLLSSMQSEDDGGPGRDLLSYERFEFHLQPVGVLVRMIQGRAAGGDYRARFINFEDVMGSAGPDRIYGDARSNFVYGLDEDDYLDGRGGKNTLDGGGGVSDDCYNYETQTGCE